MARVSWAQWRAELKTPLAPERRGDRSTEPLEMTGYWRIESAKTKPDYPVSIWTRVKPRQPSDGEAEEGDATIFQIGHKLRNTAEARTEWDEFATGTFLKCIAVSKADWDRALASGFWPSDGKPARQMSEAEKAGIPETVEGGNAPPIEATLEDQIKTLAEAIEATVEPTTVEQANALEEKLGRMRRLLKLAEAEREKEKEPFLTGGREVDAKWQAIGLPGGNAYRAGELRKKAFLKKEEDRVKAEAEKERKRQQAIIDAENQRIREENEKRLAEALAAPVGDKQPEVEFIEEVKAAPVVEVPKVSVGSAFGRSSGLKTKSVATVTDAAKLAQHFLDTKDEDFLKYLLERAQKAVRAKITLPGVAVEDQRV